MTRACSRCGGTGHVEGLTIPDIEQEPCVLCGGRGVIEEEYPS